jgi:hypothetical protein
MPILHAKIQENNAFQNSGGKMTFKIILPTKYSIQHEDKDFIRLQSLKNFSFCILEDTDTTK